MADTIPLIDLQHWRFDAAGRSGIARALDAAFTDVGFCYIANTGVPNAVVEAAFNASHSASS